MTDKPVFSEERKPVAERDKGLLQEAFTMIAMLRSFIACGESTTKDDDAAIVALLDRLRSTGAEPLPTTPNCHRCGRPCVQGNQGSWMCDCTSTPFDCRLHSVQEAFTMIGMLRSFIACGESTTKDDDAAIASILDKLRIAGAQPIPAVSPTRTDKDYAIEHGGYLADAAEAYIDERNKYDALDQVDVAEQDLLNDHFRALNSAIYEFRKRAKRSQNDLP